MSGMAHSIDLVDLELPAESNIILAQAHFIKTAEDVYEALNGSMPGIRFGIAFNEASGPRLIRTEGSDEVLVSAAARNASMIGAGHLLVVLIAGAYPINVMQALKAVPEITTVYCATANPARAVVLREGERAAIIGVMDGGSPAGLESEADRQERRDLLRKIGYKK